MLDVTPAAKDELHGLLDEYLGHSTGAEASFRLVADICGDDGDVQPQLELKLDVRREGDSIVQHQGRDVLIVDGDASDLLTGLTLDVVETAEGRTLTLRK